MRIVYVVLFDSFDLFFSKFFRLKIIKREKSFWSLRKIIGIFYRIFVFSIVIIVWNDCVKFHTFCSARASSFFVRRFDLLFSCFFFLHFTIMRVSNCRHSNINQTECVNCSNWWIFSLDISTSKIHFIFFLLSLSQSLVRVFIKSHC